ncbi:MAG: hypothetical protein SAL07_23670 [Oscillatoria sp. PMC 1051.18]|nr:hypothetical protein [Oscillatoria sp. PMC 1050.18]MEC5032912.1 hypothetical protein [Oscillatoria sp. PMC 1051.18]
MQSLRSCTQSGTINRSSPPSPLIRQTVCFDGGNRTILWINPNNQIQKIPSFIKYLQPWEEAEHENSSVVIEYKDLKYCLGNIAADLGGRPVHEENKCSLALHLALAALEPNPGERVVTIEKLLIALPDKRKQDDVELLKRLEGTHEFTRNSKQIIATVRQVIPVDETRGAYQFALKYNLFRSQSHINGILDLGGGTGIARLYSPNQTLIRKADVIVPGTNQIVTKINASLLPVTGLSQNLNLMMDAIEDGSFQIGTSDINFANQFPRCRDEWLTEIRGKLKTAWGEYFSKIGEVLIIGGSAPLAEPLEAATKGRFKIAKHSQIPNFAQYINLRGMEVM